ncbi:MAG: hypothetical protein V1924_08455 [Candidatus Bathyarchaeota archaeon]
MAPKVKVSPRDDGADITINGYIIEITVKPIETLPEKPETPHPIQLTGTTTGVPIETPPEEPEAQTHPDTTIEDLKLDLGPYLEDLYVTEDQEHIVVTPKRYLGRKKFNSIASIVRQMDGSYVSSGKKSRFLIPRKKQQQPDT